MNIVKERHTFGEPYQMYSGSAIAQEATYKVVKGSGKNIWLVPTNNDPSLIHVDMQNPNSDGYGGRVLRFPLEDGMVHEAKGPWNSNADALYRETGIDLRDKHKTYGIIAFGRENSDGPHWMIHDYIDVVHLDSEPTLGEFGRIEKMAQKIANESGRRVFYQVKTAGGGSAGSKDPQEAFNE